MKHLLTFAGIVSVVYYWFFPFLVWWQTSWKPFKGAFCGIKQPFPIGGLGVKDLVFNEAFWECGCGGFCMRKRSFRVELLEPKHVNWIPNWQNMDWKG